VIADDMTLTETDASDETRLARRRLVQAATAVSLAGGVGAQLATRPALADERGHNSNVAHHSHTDKDGKHNTHVVFHDLDDGRLKHMFRQVGDPAEAADVAVLDETGGPFDHLSVFGDDAGTGHVVFLNRADGHFHHHEIHRDDHSKDQHHNMTEHHRMG
jgi:hypothetical protein